MNDDVRMRLASLPTSLLSPFNKKLEHLFVLCEQGEAKKTESARFALDLLTRVVDGLLNAVGILQPREFWKKIEVLQSPGNLPAEVIALMHQVRREVRKVTHPMPNQPIPPMHDAAGALLNLFEWLGAFLQQRNARICYACSSVAHATATNCSNPACGLPLDDPETAEGMSAIPLAEPASIVSPESMMSIPVVTDERPSSVDEILTKMDSRSSQSAIESAFDQAVEEAKAKQRQMLTDPPDVDGIEIALVYEPAKEIGCDFYDFRHVKEQRLVATLGSVSTSGVEAWGDMTLALRVLRIHAKMANSPRELLGETYKDLLDDLVDNKTLISAQVGILDLSNFQFTLSRAGQPPLVVFNPARHPDPVQRLAPAGKVMGPATGAQAQRFADGLAEEVTQLYSGDYIVWSTPGVPNTQAPNKASFGVDGMMKLIRSYEGNTAADMANHILSGVISHRQGKEQDTDYTLVVMHLC